MSNFIISRLEETDITYEQIVALLHRSFQERLDQGLHYTCSEMTVDSFQNATRNGIVLVALDSDSGSLVGTATTHLYIDKKGCKYGENENLAIHPDAKRNGIGSALLKKRLEILKEAGAEYVISDTAVNADSAVRYHLKNGFKIVGLRSFTSTNYYSYVFRLQLIRNTLQQKLYTYDGYCKCLYLYSAVCVKALFKSDGSRTCFGLVIQKLHSKQ